MSRERIAGDQELVDEPSPDEMFLDDALEDRRIALRIPRTLRIDDRDRADLTDAQAVGFRAPDSALLRQAELLQPALQLVPSRPPAILPASYMLGLVAAEKDVTSRRRHADAFLDDLLGTRELTLRPRRLQGPTSSRARRTGPCSPQ